MKTLPILPLLLLAFSACQPAPPPFDAEQEKAAIRRVIGEETESYYRQDFAAWKNTGGSGKSSTWGTITCRTR